MATSRMINWTTFEYVDYDTSTLEIIARGYVWDLKPGHRHEGGIHNEEGKN
jgi:hypothetical protein